MRLILVTGTFPQRSETFIYRKAVALAEAGHEVVIKTRRVGDWSLYPKRLPSHLRVEVLPTEELGAHNLQSWLRSMAGAAPQLSQLLGLVRGETTGADARRRFLRHLGFVGQHADVVHFEFLGQALLYPYASALLRCPEVISCRGQDIHLLAIRPPEVVAASVACLRRASAVHCVSDELANDVASLLGNDKNIIVNRPAVDTVAIAPREARAARSRPLRIITAGRLVWVKGFEHLLRALGLLATMGVDFEAAILGEGPLYSQLRFTVEDLGLADRVQLGGGVTNEEVIRRLRDADVFVLSSHAEGISNGVLEAMAVGLPIVTTAAGGMREIVTDGVEGFVVPVRDPRALAERLATLAQDSDLRIAMGARARERVESTLSIESQIARFAALYERARGTPQ